MLKIVAYTFIISLSLLGLSAKEENEISQKSDHIINHFIFHENNENGICFTPMGKASISDIYYVDNNHFLNIVGNKIQKLNKITGKLECEFDIGEINKNDTYYRKTPELSKNSDYYHNLDGWVTYAECSIFGENPPPISNYSAKWIVPSPPLKNSNQLLYIFISLMSIESGVGHIVQPVLQWGKSPAGGGNYWSICNWYVASNNLFFHDTLIKVNPGDTLLGTIKMTNTSENKYDYNSSFGGYSSNSGFQINNLPELIKPHVVLESYNVNGCDEYPLDEKLKITKMNLLTEGVQEIRHSWITYDGLNDCSQFTKVINESLTDGEVDIHFHSPAPIDNFDEIHVFPNPVGDYLHISPKNALNNCFIDVYDSFGRLVDTKFYEILDNEFNYSFQNHASGVYIINFSYSYDQFSYRTKNHSFKIIKK